MTRHPWEHLRFRDGGRVRCAMCLRLLNAPDMTNEQTYALFELAERIRPLRRAYGRKKGRHR